MGCTPAPACRAALDEATRLWPTRNRASDGICGDASHQARRSDHNLGNAWDLTHDPAAGVDCNQLAEQMIHDPRVTYVIWNRRIYNRSVASRWRTYTGSNPHTHHMHVSIGAASRGDVRPWFTTRQEDDEVTDEQMATLGKWMKDQRALTVKQVTAALNESEWATRRILADLVEAGGIDKSKLTKETVDWLAKAKVA